MNRDTVTAQVGIVRSDCILQDPGTCHNQNQPFKRLSDFSQNYLKKERKMRQRVVKSAVPTRQHCRKLYLAFDVGGSQSQSGASACVCITERRHEACIVLPFRFDSESGLRRVSWWYPKSKAHKNGLVNPTAAEEFATEKPSHGTKGRSAVKNSDANIYSW